MKVLLINGSPHRTGCTYTALKEVEKGLIEQGAETEIFWIGSKPVAGCMGCMMCKTGTGKCVIESDQCNELIEMMKAADGVVIGSPVYYASPNGSLLALLDRAFFSGAGSFKGKVGACVVSARRAGTTAALEVLNKYFLISQMPLASSCYWNMVHGNRPSEVIHDAEGMCVMRTLGRNMAWMIKCFKAGTAQGIEMPANEEKPSTNFIR